MKKLLLLLTIGSVSCECKHESPTTELYYKSVNFKADGLYSVKEIEIEGCEYFSYRTHNDVRGLTHKGNCNNPIHFKTK